MSDAQVPYHVGIVVPDIQQAAASFAALLGYEFNEPARLPMADLDDRLAGTRGPSEVHVTYSRTGPLRIELIEAAGDGVYAPALAGGVHHVGVWESDPEQRLARLEAEGAVVEAVLRGTDGTISVFYVRPADSADVRVEYVNAAQRERLERWFETSVLS